MSDIYIEIENLPIGWSLASIESFADVLMGQSPPSDTYNDEGIGLPFFQGKAEFTELHPVVRKWCNASNKIAEPNDILMSVRAPVGATNIANVKCCIGRGLSAIRYSHCNKLLFYFFRLIENKLDEKGTGTTFRAISGDVIKNAQIYLPPLPEQHRIVAKIEELFSSLDKGIESLKTAQQQLKVYRQAVLKWAFEGRFGYAQRPPNSVKEGELPEGWERKTLGDIVNKNSQKTLPRELPDAKFIGMDCIEPNTLKPFKFYEFKEFKSAGNVFKKNQVLYGRMRPYLNKVYKAEIDGACSGEFIVLDCLNGFNPDLLKYILHHRDFVSFANHKTSGDRPRISFEEISDYPVNVYKSEEQHHIVSEIESRLSVCDKIEESITTSLQQAEALRQSILKKAFEGRLLSEAELNECRNDPSWEPASVLLERIASTKPSTRKAKQETLRQAQSDNAKKAPKESK